MERRRVPEIRGPRDNPRDKKKKYNVMEIHEMSLQMIKLYYGVVYSYAVNKSIFEEILWVFQKQPK